LALCDEARAQFVEVTEEFTNTYALLLAEIAKASYGIIHILGDVTDDLSLAFTSLGLGEVVEAVVEVASNSKKLLVTINLLTEVNVVDLI